MHKVCKNRLEAYAEGALCWPLSWVVERHTHHCHECRTELRDHITFLAGIDRVLFRPDEMVRTASITVRRTLSRSQIRSKKPAFQLMVAGAVLALLILAIGPMELREWFTPGVTVVSASSWSEGVATSVTINTETDPPDTLLVAPSTTSRGHGITAPIVGTEERGG